MPTPLDLVSNADLANDSQIRDWSHVQIEHKWRLLHKCGSDKIMQGTGGKHDGKINAAVIRLCRELVGNVMGKVFRPTS